MKKLVAIIAATFMFSASFHTASAAKVILVSNKNPKPNKDACIKDADPARELYSSIDFGTLNKLNPDVFGKAFTGFQHLKAAGKLPADAHLLSICDFSLSSNEKRLWVIDTDAKKILFNSLVAHGKNTGEEFAERFSNAENSLESSLGFYVTQETYEGDNGYSLKLEGMDKGFNDNALQRSIVMHGADYVSEDFAKSEKRIGRSWGCPAVPRALAEPIINTLKNKNCLFIYYPDQNYLNSSEWLKG